MRAGRIETAFNDIYSFYKILLYTCAKRISGQRGIDG